MYATVEPEIADTSHLEGLPDGNLILLVKAGNDLALGVLLRRHRDALYRFCLHLTHNRDDAEDVCQESMARALMRVDSLQSGSAFRSWLFSIARNLSIDSHRSRKRVCPLPDEEIAPLPLPLHHESPYEQVETHEEYQTVAQALGRLKKNHQTVLMLREVEGLSYADIATRLDLSQAAVETLLFRARKRLREEYTKTGAPAPAVAILGALRGLLSRLAAPFSGVPLAAKIAATALLLGGAAVATPAVFPTLHALAGGGSSSTIAASFSTRSPGFASAAGAPLHAAAISRVPVTTAWDQSGAHHATSSFRVASHPAGSSGSSGHAVQSGAGMHPFSGSPLGGTAVGGHMGATGAGGGRASSKTSSGAAAAHNPGAPSGTLATAIGPHTGTHSGTSSAETSSKTGLSTVRWVSKTGSSAASGRSSTAPGGTSGKNGQPRGGGSGGSSSGSGLSGITPPSISGTAGTVTGAAASAQQAAGGAAGSVQQTVSNTAAGTQQAASNTTSSAQQAASAAATTVQQTASSATSSAQQAVGAAAGGTGETAASMSGSVQQAASNAAASTQSAAGSAASTAGKTASGAAATAGKAASGATSTAGKAVGSTPSAPKAPVKGSTPAPSVSVPTVPVPKLPKP